MDELRYEPATLRSLSEASAAFADRATGASTAVGALAGVALVASSAVTAAQTSRWAGVLVAIGAAVLLAVVLRAVGRGLAFLARVLGQLALCLVAIEANANDAANAAARIETSVEDRRAA